MRVSVLPDLGAIAPDSWDALGDPDDPFTGHAFLRALERSGSVGPGTGWEPCHLVVEEGGRPVAAMPLYRKAHSYGEYIFDWGWAEAAIRAGIPYYPKLVSAVPFTPVSGRRLLLGGPVSPGDRRVAALTGAVDEVLRGGVGSSCHVLFCSAEEQATLAGADAIPRLTFQFQWRNEGYRDFDDWLSRFRHKERKQARRERRLPEGVVVEERPGTELETADIEALYGFYLDTVARKGGQDYLERAFFDALRERPLAERVWCFFAWKDGERVSGALFFQRGSGLYGRYWGCREGYGGLHFELCYHRPVARCIAEGWTRFEAGAQGIHKLKRGLLPRETYSAHWLVHPSLREAVAQAVRREAAATRRHIAELAEHGPFRAGGETG